MCSTAGISGRQFGVSLVVALAIGALNGFLVVRTKLPSFIITLATLFIIRGATIGVTRLHHRADTGRRDQRRRSAMTSHRRFSPVRFRFADPASTRGLSASFPISIFWWLLIAGIATYVLLRTRPGNWIFGMGGDQNAARNVGVPVNRMKIILFMTTASAAWLVATIQVLSVGSADTLRGEQREFYAIIAVVIGGTLLTGGYGSAIGAVFGALIFGMVQQGIIFTGVDSDWFQVFMGGDADYRRAGEQLHPQTGIGGKNDDEPADPVLEVARVGQVLRQRHRPERRVDDALPRRSDVPARR